MSETTTLLQVMERVENMSRNHRDMNIKTRDISFDNFDTIRIGSDTHPLKPIAQQSIAYRLGIPAPYLKKCPADIQAVNLNHWIRYEKNEELFFRFDGNRVRALFTGESAPSRHPIPVQVGTLIRNMPAGDSGANRQVFVIERNDLPSWRNWMPA